MEDEKLVYALRALRQIEEIYTKGKKRDSFGWRNRDHAIPTIIREAFEFIDE